MSVNLGTTENRLEILAYDYLKAILVTKRARNSAYLNQSQKPKSSPLLSPLYHSICLVCRQGGGEKSFSNKNLFSAHPRGTPHVFR